MPDIMGHWDRRCDSDDYNPQTDSIEPGYHKRCINEERIWTRRLRRELDKNLKNIGLTKTDFNNVGYKICDEGDIIKESEDFGKSRYPRSEHVGKIGEKGIIILYGSPDCNNAGNYLNQTNQALSFKEFLDKRKIPYSEEPPLEKVLKDLTRKRKKISGLLRRLNV